MILAQRGYQANSRSITVADELLVETLQHEAVSIGLIDSPIDSQGALRGFHDARCRPRPGGAPVAGLQARHRPHGRCRSAPAADAAADDGFASLVALALDQLDGVAVDGRAARDARTRPSADGARPRTREGDDELAARRARRRGDAVAADRARDAGRDAAGVDAARRRWDRAAPISRPSMATRAGRTVTARPRTPRTRVRRRGPRPRWPPHRRSRTCWRRRRRCTQPATARCARGGLGRRSDRRRRPTTPAAPARHRDPSAEPGAAAAPSPAVAAPRAGQRPAAASASAGARRDGRGGPGGHDVGAGRPAGRRRRRRRGRAALRSRPTPAPGCGRGRGRRTRVGRAAAPRVDAAGDWQPVAAFGAASDAGSAGDGSLGRRARRLRRARRRRRWLAAPSPASTRRRRSRPPRRPDAATATGAPLRRLPDSVRDSGPPATRCCAPIDVPAAAALRADAVVGRSRRPQPAGDGADGPALHGG